MIEGERGVCIKIIKVYNCGECPKGEVKIKYEKNSVGIITKSYASFVCTLGEFDIQWAIEHDNISPKCPLEDWRD